MSDIINNFFWAIERVLINVLLELTKINLSGAFNFDSIYADKNIRMFFSSIYLLMFLLLPIKLICELCVETFDTNYSINISKKILGCIVAACLTAIISMSWKDVVLSSNNLCSLIGIKDNNYLSKEIVSSVYSAFGGMEKQQSDLMFEAYTKNLNANNLKQKYVNSKICPECNKYKNKLLWDVDEKDNAGFSINQRFINKYDSLNYVWERSSFLAILGLLYFVVVMVIMNIQVAMRSINLIVYFLLFPINATSLTNGIRNAKFESYCKSMFLLLFTNIMQVILIYLTPVLVNNIFSSSKNIYIRIILLMAINHNIIQIPQLISHMFGFREENPLLFNFKSSTMMASFKNSATRAGLNFLATPLRFIKYEYYVHKNSSVYSRWRHVPWRKR